MIRSGLALLALLLLGAGGAEEGIHVRFDSIPEGWSVEKAEITKGREGPALWIGREARVSFPAPAFIAEGFDITLWVSHREALRDLRFEELVYLYHDTNDLKNRICLKKRIGTNEILFSMSDAGPGKGAEFAGDWYAMTSGELDWEAGSWHCLRIVADHVHGCAELWIDGAKVASAEGTQFPKAAGTIWLGSWSGRSQALATFDELILAPAGER